VTDSIIFDYEIPIVSDLLARFCWPESGHPFHLPHPGDQHAPLFTTADLTVLGVVPHYGNLALTFLYVSGEYACLSKMEMSLHSQQLSIPAVVSLRPSSFRCPLCEFVLSNPNEPLSSESDYLVKTRVEHMNATRTNSLH
jgi:hypothetical protein